MKTEIIPLGVGSALPMADRHFSAMALRRAGGLLLFDCGEGTQRQLLRAKLAHARLDALFITHFHGDHFFGLMGLLSTLGLLQRETPLTLVGPAGLAGMIETWPGLAQKWLTFPMEVLEVAEGAGKQVVLETTDFFVEARPLDHSTFAVGYRYEERPTPGNLDVDKARALGLTDYLDYRALKAGQAVTAPDGRRVEPHEVVGPDKPGGVFGYITDTRPCENGRLLARDADLVYHEATFTETHAARAAETGHSTALGAARLARDAGAARLLLGHFSARYQTAAPLLEEARAVFPNTEAAEELKRYPLLLPPS